MSMIRRSRFCWALVAGLLQATLACCGGSRTEPVPADNVLDSQEELVDLRTDVDASFPESLGEDGVPTEVVEELGPQCEPVSGLGLYCLARQFPPGAPQGASTAEDKQVIDADFCVLFADGAEDFSLEHEYLALVDSGTGPKCSNALGVLHLDETEVCTQVGYKRLYIHMDLTCCKPIVNNPEEQGTAFYVYVRVPKTSFMENLSQYDTVIKSDSLELCAPEKWEGYIPGK